MKLYITDMSLFVLAVFYLPVVLWLLWKLLKQPISILKKSVLAILLLAIAYAIPLGDVTVNSMAMGKVCPSAGLHIYKTVEVEGYLTDIGDGEILKKHPYRFIETKTYQTKPDGSRYYRKYERQPDGTITSELIDQPTAAYEFIFGQWYLDQERGVSVKQDVVRNRASNEFLAEKNLFNPLPGWLDNALVFRWFGYGGEDGCHGVPAYGFESNVLVPKHTANE